MLHQADVCTLPLASDDLRHHGAVKRCKCGQKLNSHFACQIACQSGCQDLAGRNTTKIKDLVAKIKNLAAKMGGLRGPGPPQPHFGSQIPDFRGIFTCQILPTILAGRLAGKNGYLTFFFLEELPSSAGVALSLHRTIA